MRKEFMPYYVSRAVLSAAFAILVAGISWWAAILAVLVFGGFLLYLHSGWFQVDTRRPLTPLRRDQRGQEIQRKALIASMIIGVLVYWVASSGAARLGVPLAGPAALLTAIITYFVTQFALFMRA
jgi:hypothetical protein